MRLLHFIIYTIFIFTEALCYNNKKLVLWYDSPASTKDTNNTLSWQNSPGWLESFPIGNGYMGAMVFGGVFKERLQLNNKNLWSGSPQDADNPLAFPAQDSIRKLLLDGRHSDAEKIMSRTQICCGLGTNRANAANTQFGCFQTLGDLYIDFYNNGKETFEDYRRELDLNNGIVNVYYSINGNKYVRTYFASYNNNVIIVKVKSLDDGKINLKASLSRPERFRTVEDNNQLLMYGTLNDGLGGDGMKYWCRLDVSIDEGEKNVSDDYLYVKDAKEVIFYVTSTTNYVGFPDYLDNGYEDNTMETVNSAEKKGYESIFAMHKADYKKYFDRVSISLDNNPKDTIPLNIRLDNVRKGNDDLHLQELLYQYGRYLLISSSRENTLPANLQGIWCSNIQSAWNCDYHFDINIQMNYWIAQLTNLGELFEPYVKLIESIQGPGRKTAKIHYNSDGWCLHPVVNVWGFTSPGERYGWGFHISAAGWACNGLWQQYEFFQDWEYLKRIYPILRSTAIFYKDWLYHDEKSDKWISIPSISPENSFFTKEGYKTALCLGSAHDHQIIKDLFNSYIAASDILGINDSLLDSIRKIEVKSTEIGSDGRLLEWDQEYKEVEPGHRHISHLYALYPSNMISKDTPELFEAAKKTLLYRLAHMKGEVGWSLAWMTSLAARLNDSELAYSFLDRFMEKCLYNNLFAKCPPFQIDANFGIVAGMTEMLIHSDSRSIEILPALPKKWNCGYIKGICVRGGYEIDINWNENKLREITIKNKTSKGKELVLRYKNKVRNIYIKKNDKKKISVNYFI